jgi:hypothetical protein
MCPSLSTLFLDINSRYMISYRILPQFGSGGGAAKLNFQFWVAFITELYNERAALSAGHPSSEQRDGNFFGRIMDQCLETATHSLKYDGSETKVLGYQAMVTGTLKLIGL